VSLALRCRKTSAQQSSDVSLELRQIGLDDIPNHVGVDGVVPVNKDVAKGNDPSIVRDLRDCGRIALRTGLGIRQ